MSNSFLIIQTAFTGDVILSTSIAEKINSSEKNCEIDFLVRKGNESLFHHHPYVRNVIVWEKRKDKYKNMFLALKEIRKNKYDVVINLQRFTATGIISVLSSGKKIIGFNKNPFSIFFTNKVKHNLRKGIHEIDRNQSLIADITGNTAVNPRLYPSTADFMSVQNLKHKNYITISPASVWFTKTFPAYKWIELAELYRNKFPGNKIYLLGSKDEFTNGEYLKSKAGDLNIINLCGSLSFLESAALMKDAEMNYVNDSAPLHLASAINAPVTAVYCSTVPEFGFGPLSDSSRIIENNLSLECRPCGLHGYKDCPVTHFKCAHSIDVKEIING